MKHNNTAVVPEVPLVAELKPCPFCGEAGELTTTPGIDCTRHSIYCITCLAEGPTTYDPERAAERWNERAAAAPRHLVETKC